MKYDALQGDFSFGEISPSAQGDVEGAIYKAAASRVINMVPTRTKSLASRAGGKWAADGLNAQTGALDNSPVQHLPLVNSPVGDIVIEIGQHGLRLMDEFGPLDWNQYTNGPVLAYTVQDGTNAWGDPASGVVYLSNLSGIGQKQYITTPPNLFFGSNTIIEPNTGFPSGTNDHWTFKGKIAGDAITVEIRDVDFTLVSSVTIDGRNGIFSYDFLPTGFFSVTLRTANNVVSASQVWDLQLFKNSTKFSQQLDTAHLDNLAPDVNRIRVAAFWISADSPYKDDPATYWVFFAGGPQNQWAGQCLSWTVKDPAHPELGGAWSFQPVPCLPESFALIKNSTTVAVYQDRVIFGNNSAAGRPQLIASVTGFMRPLDGELVSGLVTDFGNKVNMFVFKVIKQKYVIQGPGTAGAIADFQEKEIIVNNFTGPAKGVVRAIRVSIPGNPVLVTEEERLALNFVNFTADGVLGTPVLSVKLNGIPVKVTPAPGGFHDGGTDVMPLTPNVSATPGDGTGLGMECWSAYPANYNVNPAHANGSAFACEIFLNDGTGDTPPMSQRFLSIGDILEFTTLPLAEDPLQLTLASPTGNISFLNVLRGMVMGTTTAEKLFPPDTPFALDPATGSSIIAEDESEQGSDDALNAVNVNDKILFVQLGRKTLRQAYISFATQGGLAAEDIGQMGEHLTGRGIRSFCLLKTPVQRVVMAFDDGTGAVMTLNANNTQAWSQFTIPAVYGGIYSVAALQTKSGAQLFVGTENGTTLVWKSFESKISPKILSSPQAAPLAPIKSVQNPENPFPPIMDGWMRVAVTNDLGTQAIGIPDTLIGQNVWAFIKGQLVGPYPVVADSGADGSNAVTFPLALDLDTTWTDQLGRRRPQDCYIGVIYPAHGFTTLPLEGGNPAGTAQGKISRKAQLYLRFVDSYMPLVNGDRPEEIQPGDLMDLLATRVTGDVRCTELEFNRAAVVTVDQDLPLRIEVSAFFGGTAMSGV